MHLAKRSADYGKILRIYIHEPAVYSTISRHYAFTGRFCLWHVELAATMRHKRIDLHEAVLVEQVADTLTRRLLPAVVLLLDFRLAAAQNNMLAACFQITDLFCCPHSFPSVQAGRRPLCTTVICQKSNN